MKLKLLLYLLIILIERIGRMILGQERGANSNVCFSERKLSTTTTFTVEYKGCIIVIKNVPCLECLVCGEVIFSNDVSQKLETLVAAAKKILQDIAVIDFAKVA